MRKSRELHPVSWITALIVTGSFFLAGPPGGVLRHIQTYLLGKNPELGAALFGPETGLIAASTMLVVEALIRRWNGSRQFGLRDLFMLTTAAAVVLSLLATEHRLANQVGGLPDDMPWLVKTPAIFGLACVVYALAWGIEYAVRRVRDFGKAERRNGGASGHWLAGLLRVCEIIAMESRL